MEQRIHSHQESLLVTPKLSPRKYLSGCPFSLVLLAGTSIGGLTASVSLAAQQAAVEVSRPLGNVAAVSLPSVPVPDAGPDAGPGAQAQAPPAQPSSTKRACSRESAGANSARRFTSPADQAHPRHRPQLSRRQRRPKAAARDGQREVHGRHSRFVRLLFHLHPGGSCRLQHGNRRHARVPSGSGRLRPLLLARGGRSNQRKLLGRIHFSHHHSRRLALLHPRTRRIRQTHSLCPQPCVHYPFRLRN